MYLFNNLGSIFGNNIAIYCDNDSRISYTELEDYSNIIRDSLPVRSLVFSLNRNTVGSLIGYYTFLKNGIVPLMIESKIDYSYLHDLIKTYSPSYLWLPTELCENFEEGKVVYSVFDYSLLKLNNVEQTKLHPNLALLLGTSGSTGSPKLVKLTYENIKANAFSIIEYLKIDQNERAITTLPMSYSYGLSIINSHFYSGATMLLTNRSIMEREFWAFLKKEQPTSFSGIPYTFEMLKKLRFFRQKIPFVKTLTQAGGKLRNELIKEFTEFCQANGKQFFVMYGQTEATARMSYLPPVIGLEKLGSMGIAIPRGEFNLVDENKETIEVNDTVGELVYKGANVSMGYALCKEDLSKPDKNNGVLYTGDLAKKDKDGFYYIVGRKKRFIKLYGNRVNLDATEQILKTKIEDCACVGDDDKMNIYITNGSMIKEVQEFIAHKTGINTKAFSVKYIDEIPKNASGKTIYSNLELSDVSR
jgi:long-chain acyl-CoA synthetase